MISNISNQVIIQGNLVKAPVKIGTKYQFAIISKNDKSDFINLFFEIETSDRRIYRFVKDLITGSSIKCTCLLGNKIYQDKLIPTLECFDIRAV